MPSAAGSEGIGSQCARDSGEVADIDTGQALVTAAAVLGAVTGSVALVQQGLLFRHSGPRIEVGLRVIWARAEDAKPFSGPLGALIESQPAEGHDRRMLAVEVRNSGRGPATVEEVTACLPSGVRLGAEPNRWSKRFEPESTGTWIFALSAIKVAADASQCEPVVYATVTLGSGKQVNSKPMRVE